MDGPGLIDESGDMRVVVADTAPRAARPATMTSAAGEFRASRMSRFEGDAEDADAGALGATGRAR